MKSIKLLTLVFSFLLASLALVGFKAVQALAVAMVGVRVTGLRDDARIRSRHAARAVLLALVAFLLLSLGPALIWRVRFGVWIG